MTLKSNDPSNRCLDNEPRSVDPFDLSIVKPNDSQLGLIDLFYCMTLFCVIIGCHSFISEPGAVLLCGAVAVYAVLRFIPCQYGAIGGMLAFGTSVICLPFMLNFGGLSAGTGILLCLAFPPTAYVLGAIYTEFRELN
jgi:hypothetical protein